MYERVQDRIEDKRKDRLGDVYSNIEDRVREYCAGSGYDPTSVQAYSPRSDLYGMTTLGNNIWVSINGTAPNNWLVEEKLLSIAGLSSTFNENTGYLYFKPAITNLRYVFLPADAISGENKLTEGNNVMIDSRVDPERYSKFDFALFIVPRHLSYEGVMRRRESLGLAVHEATHSFLLANLISNGIVGENAHPNHIHPVPDEGLSLCYEAFALAVAGHYHIDTLLQKRDVLTYLLQDQRVFNFIHSYRHRFGIVLPREEIIKRGYSADWLKVAKGINAEDIDLLDPEIIDRVNFRRCARLNSSGEITPPFVDQDSVIKLSYSIGAALVWALSINQVESGRPPLYWFPKFIRLTQEAYIKDPKVDFWPIVRECFAESDFPNLTKDNLNNQMIALLKGATTYAARMAGYPQPEQYLDDYLTEYEALSDFGKSSLDLEEALEMKEAIMSRGEWTTKRHRNLALSIRNFQKRERSKELLVTYHEGRKVGI